MRSKFGKQGHHVVKIDNHTFWAMKFPDNRPKKSLKRAITHMFEDEKCRNRIA